MGTLSDLRSTIVTSLGTALSGWEVVSDEISFPRDKLVEVVYLDLNSEMVDFGTLALTGNLGIVLYKRFGTSYSEQLDAVENVVETLKELNLENVSVGNQTPTQASISSPSVTTDGKQDFRVIIVSVALEIIV